MYGFEQQPEAKDFGKKGLNSGAKLVDITYNPNGGAGGTPTDVLDVSVKVGEFTYKTRIFDLDPNKVYSGGSIINNSHPDYKKEFDKLQRNFTGYLSDLMACFLPAAQIAEIFQTSPVTNFKQYAQLVEKVIKSNPVWNTVDLDVFLQYQYSPSQGKNIAYLELPRNNKHGRVFAPGVNGVVWKEQIDERGLKYIADIQDQNVILSSSVHPFKRAPYYLDMNFWNQVKLDAEDTGSQTGMFGGGETPLTNPEQSQIPQGGNWNFNN